MNKKLLTTLALALVSSAHANLIDLTPGGYDILNPPQVIVDWNNYYYSLPHGERPRYLGEDAITVTGMFTQQATVSWDLSGTDYGLQWIYVYHFFAGYPMQGVGHFYQVSEDSWVTGSGAITLDGTTTIEWVLPFGNRLVPDSGATILLFGLSLVGLFYARH